ncbi:MAG: arsenic efflux protein [Lachnospiraceae bacterium]|nr:arsenic efflux protein [Lachnospiraceae bacterium]
MIQDAALDTLKDGIRLLPFLFITYLVMEYIEHKTSDRTRQIMKKSGKLGSVFGGLLGIVPQCGFSAAASNLYAGRIITLGTLLAVFLSTSDEMLPILISEQAPVHTIVKILAVKAVIGILAGILTDFFIHRKKKDIKEEMRIEHMCDHQHCHCAENKILKSALNHTLQIFIFIVVITFLLNLLIGCIGEERLASVILGKSVFGPAIAGLVGLIPNCASSVVLTQLYLKGLLGGGSLIAGLLAGSGVGLLILYKVNDDVRENVRITFLLYGIGVLSGILLETAGFIF